MYGIKFTIKGIVIEFKMSSVSDRPTNGHSDYGNSFALEKCLHIMYMMSDDVEILNSGVLLHNFAHKKEILHTKSSFGKWIDFYEFTYNHFILGDPEVTANLYWIFRIRIGKVA